MEPCPICASPGAQNQSSTIPPIFTCARCGSFRILHGEAPTGHVHLAWILDRSSGTSPLRRARLSHIVRRQFEQLPADERRCVTIRLSDLVEARLDEKLPDPVEQLDSLVLWIGGRQPTYLEAAPLDAAALEAWVGAPILQSPGQVMGWFVIQEGAKALFEPRGGGYRLTLKGWQRYDLLRRQASESRLAFMAMKFGRDDVDRALVEAFKPAAADAGFDLRPVNEGQGAGLIDDQMRVALRRAPFVVADLTHASHGAYWEAGFGEGLGKPVIYTCHKDHWTPSAEGQGSHFDTNHLVTIIWDPDDLADARRRLAATIRATLPDLAKLE